MVCTGIIVSVHLERQKEGICCSGRYFYYVNVFQIEIITIISHNITIVALLSVDEGILLSLYVFLTCFDHHYDINSIQINDNFLFYFINNLIIKP